MAWTDEKIKQLKKLWKKGKSTVEIGRELGISKNAVVGKVHRLDLPSRESPIKRPVIIVAPKKEKKTDNNEKMTLMNLRLNSCRWPIGDPKDEDFHFCGNQTEPGKPYCAEHCKIAYTSLKELTLQNAKAKKERLEQLEREKQEKAALLEKPKKEKPVKEKKVKPEKPVKEKKVKAEKVKKEKPAKKADK